MCILDARETLDNFLTVQLQVNIQPCLAEKAKYELQALNLYLVLIAYHVIQYPNGGKQPQGTREVIFLQSGEKMNENCIKLMSKHSTYFEFLVSKIRNSNNEII